MLTKHFHGIHCQSPKGDLEPVRGSIQAQCNYPAILYKGHEPPQIWSTGGLGVSFLWTPKDNHFLEELVLQGRLFL